MTPAEAARIMNTARKHNEAVTDLALELMMMLSETFKDEILKLENENDRLLDAVEQLKVENTDLSAKLAEKVQKAPLKVANPPSKEILEEIAKNVPVINAEKPRRGRPPKKKTDAEAIHELAKDIFSE